MGWGLRFLISNADEDEDADAKVLDWVCGTAKWDRDLEGFWTSCIIL